MAKEILTYIKLQVRAGEASPAGSIGPALGSKGVKIMDFCTQFNAQTQHQKGDILPVVMTVYKDKSFSFVVKTPPVAALIMKKLNLKKGSAQSNRDKVATISWKEIEEIACAKKPDLNTLNLESAKRMIAGTARSMGILVQK